jgi:polar amino acid transport system substrate-binding protein
MLWAIGSGPALAGDLIAVDAADAPFMYDANGEAAGLYPVVITEAYRRMGVEVSIAAMPWKRALDGADNALNGVAGLYKTEERLKKYDYSDKLFDEVVTIYVRKGHGFPFAVIEDLRGHSVGVIRGWSYGDAFDTARRDGLFTTEEASGDEQNFVVLDAGHIDCVLAIREAAAAAIASHDWRERFEALAVPLSKNPSYVAFNKSAGKQADLRRLDAAIAAMRADGSFDRLIQATIKPVVTEP